MKRSLPFFIGLCFCIFLIPKTFAENKATESTQIEFKLIKDNTDKNNLIFEEEVPLTVQDIASAKLNIMHVNKKNIASYRPEQPDIIKGFDIWLNLTDEGQKKLLDIPKKYKGKTSLALFTDGKYRTSIFIPLKPKTLIFIGGFSEKEAQLFVDRINNKN